jgi:predicted glycoside hydrolase/deacetylase ChbG (UPF0249 family)
MDVQEKSLSEQLGYGPDERLLIINCDDLGSSHAANVATYEAMTRGIASSATLMVPCPWAYEAVRMFAGMDIGVHLTLTAEYPGYRWRSLTGAASLHDADGYLPRTIKAVWDNARLEDVRAECRAQIDQAHAWGVDVTHLDTHMGTMALDPRYFEIFLDLAEAYRLPVRMVNPLDDARAAYRSREPARARGLLFPDNWVSYWARPMDPLMRKLMPRLEPGITEFMLHPVVDGPELRGYDPEQHPVRSGDYACAVDPQIAQFIAGEGFKTISYRPLRELQRAKG